MTNKPPKPKGDDLMSLIKEAKETLKKGQKRISMDFSEILRRRAESIAIVTSSNDEFEKKLSIIEFELGKEKYAFETIHLKEVTNTNKIAELPSTPDYIYGIINLRGKIITVIDLKKYLHLNYIGINDHTSIIIVDYSGTPVGFVVDDIIGIKENLESNIQQTKPKLQNIKETFLVGINNDTTIILDVIKLLDDSHILVSNKDL